MQVGERILRLLRERDADLDQAMTQSIAAGAADCDAWLGSLDQLMQVS